MKFPTTRFSPKSTALLLFILAFSSIWLILFLIFLQPLGGIVSIKFAAISGAIALTLTLPIFLLMRLCPDLFQIPVKSSINRLLFLALFFCLVVWLVFPLLQNSLLAPNASIILNFQGNKNGFVDITWVKNGFGDIPYKALRVNQDSQIQPEYFQVTLNEKGSAELSWKGKVWKQVSMVMKVSKPVKVNAKAGNENFNFELNPTINQEYELILPVKSEGYYLLINLLVLPFFFIVVFYFLFLFYIFFWISSLNKIDYKSPVIKILKWPLFKAVWGLTTIIYLILTLMIIATGFYNRLFMDDFCYLNIFRQHGFLGAIASSYINVNGRFTSHLLNFLAFSFGKTNIPFGPLIAILGVGISLFFLFNHLFRENNPIDKEGKSIYRWVGFTFTVVILVTMSILAPSLYESLDWALHALIVTGSLCLVNLFAGLALYFSNSSHHKSSQILQAVLFALLGFFAMGFSETSAVFLLSVYSLVALFLLTRRKLKQYWGLTFGCGIGIIAGILLVASSPASVNRVNSLGFTGSVSGIIGNLFELIQTSFRNAFLDNSGYGAFAFLIALLVGYSFGRALPIAFRFEDEIPHSAFGQFLLLLMPFLLTIATLLPSAIVNNYLPMRTLIIPIYFLVVQYFIISFFFGHRDSARHKSTQVLLILTSISVLAVGLIGLNLFMKTTKEIILFASEFDRREAEIYEAKTAGLKEVKLTPFTNTISMDISSDRSNWYVRCLNEYYGINLSVDRTIK
jgi:hypothetical protein